DNEIRSRQRKQEHPGKGHELVIAETWQGSTNPDVEKQKTENLQYEPDDRQHCLQPSWAANRPMPTAEKEQSRQAGHSNHVGVFGHEEHGEFHSAVFRV